MRKAVLVTLVNIAALVIASLLFPGIIVHTPVTFVLAGIVLGLVNLTIRPILILLTLPVSLLTLGLFVLVVNAWAVMITAAILPGFRISGFWVALLTSIVVSLFNWFAKDVWRN